ncbi:MAG: YkgJ family cysteine cluster protein [Verrucomicrobia bacterium]|nr:YkgJ family cysteine cluster protein [Verrucomicrobiota bacterium]MBS0637293.1 YkgJ family cysteine cluster protein [Verrucomicrobiota bacterium]
MISSSADMEQAEVWYKNGLRFHCTGCGKCCTGQPGFAWVSLDEIVAIAEYLGLTIDQFAKKHLREVNGRYALKEHVETYACTFLDGKACRIYPVRPKQCKTFPWWKENLKTKEDWEEAARYCEGINHPEAPLIPISEIHETM